MTTVTEVNQVAGRLAEFVKQVQAGDEVLFTQDHKPVARLVSVSEQATVPGSPLRIRSLQGHRVLAPVVSQVELAEEMFARR